MLSVGLDSLWNVEWCVERWVRLVVTLFVECGMWNVWWGVERWVRLFVECGVVC